MNCKDFESLMADALGGELAARDRPAFDAHLKTCERCRSDLESALAALERMRSLPGPDPAVELRSAAERPSPRRPPAPVPNATHWQLGGLLRYAASVLIAFAAGYVVHPLADSASPSSTPERIVERDPEAEVSGARVPGQGSGLPVTLGRSFEAALAGAHRRSPSSSDLTKCLIAMFHAGH